MNAPLETMVDAGPWQGMMHRLFAPLVMTTSFEPSRPKRVHVEGTAESRGLSETLVTPERHWNLDTFLFSRGMEPGVTLVDKTKRAIAGVRFRSRAVPAAELQRLSK